MIKALIIEDDENKLIQLTDFINNNFVSFEVTKCGSYQSGLKNIVGNKYNVIMLDMSMPTFDITPTSDGGRFRTYAGKDILDEMFRLEISSTVIVVTQFDIFGDGDNYKSLSELINELESDYPDNYFATVYYNASQSNWIEELKEFIQKAINLD